MHNLTSFCAAVAIATTAFIFTMLTKPPVSESRPVSRIDTYELTLHSTIASGEDYDCN